MIALARLEKISPTGASLKYGSVEPSRAGSSSAATCDGKLPYCSKIRICCSGAVIQAANSFASSWCVDDFGTAR